MFLLCMLGQEFTSVLKNFYQGLPRHADLKCLSVQGAFCSRCFLFGKLFQWLSLFMLIRIRNTLDNCMHAY